MKLSFNNNAEKPSILRTIAINDFANVTELSGDFGDLVLEHMSIHGLYGAGAVFAVLGKKDGRFKSHSKGQLVAEFERVKSIPEVLPYLAITALFKAMNSNKNKYKTEEKVDSVARVADLAFLLDPQGFDPILENPDFNQKNMLAIVDLIAYGADYPGLDENGIQQAAKCLEALNVPRAEEMIMQYLEDEKSALNENKNMGRVDLDQPERAVSSLAKNKHQYDGMEP